MSERVGVDVGGTFTDLVTVEEEELIITKVPSTPSAPEEGVISGIKEVGIPPSKVAYFGHGTTVATNAVLEQTWASTALVTTAGFRDAIEIGRGVRPSLYDLRAEKPDPIVPRKYRFEVTERIDDQGNIDRALDEDSVESVIHALSRIDIESVAISLLFSFENDTHERRLTNAIQEALPDVHVSESSRILPEIREYERTLATTLNAGLKPVMERYLARLEAQIDAIGITAPLRIMQSNGGSIAVDHARERPIQTLLSGPAAGVQGAAYIANQSGHPDVITMDMGGTSCDLSLVTDGEPIVSTEGKVGAYPIGVPMVNVHTIGAGGGSIAWIDDGNALRVGPRSAGADPGPICYGRGGRTPTVTDAHVALGRIDPAGVLPNTMDPAPRLAIKEIESQIAKPLGLSIPEAAQGILDIANANMERALRVVSVERGYDPRTFSLVAYGGAGPLHAPSLATMLDIPTVLIPRTAGVLSALGLVISDVIHDHSVSRVRQWNAIDPDELESQFIDFAEAARPKLVDDGFPEDAITFERAVDIRYRGQSFALTIEAPSPVDLEGMEEIADRFHAQHNRRYGHASPDEPLELVTIRLRTRGIVDPPDLRDAPPRRSTERQPAERDVHFEGIPVSTPVFERTQLTESDRINGPAIIEGPESTVLLHPDQQARIDAIGTIVIEMEDR